MKIGDTGKERWIAYIGEMDMCMVTIFDEKGKPVVIEVTPEIFQVFLDYEREMERQRKADFRHRDLRSWDTCMLFELSTEPLERTWERLWVIAEMKKAFEELTPKQHRRILLHFIYGYTYREIAEMEGSNKATVMRSVNTALKKLRKKLVIQ